MLGGGALGWEEVAEEEQGARRKAWEEIRRGSRRRRVGGDKEGGPGAAEGGQRGGGGFFEAEVEVEGAAPRPGLQRGKLGWGLVEAGEVEGGVGIGAEEVGLLDGLRGSGTAVGKGAVGGEGDEGEALVVSFDEGGEEFRGGGARGSDDGDGALVVEDAAEREVGGGAFFEVVPEAEAGNCGKEDEEGAVAGAGADHAFADSRVGKKGLEREGGEEDLGRSEGSGFRHVPDGVGRRGEPSCA